MAGESWFSCENSKKILNLDQLIRLMTANDGNDNPALRVYVVNTPAPLNSALESVLITDPAGTKTLAGLYAEYQIWKIDNADKIPVRVTHIIGDDGKNGILIEFQ